MNANDLTLQIRQIEVLRAHKRVWQLGITLALVLLLIGCLVSLRSAVLGLTLPGPTQDAFVSDLSERLQKNVVPTIQDMGTQALHEIDFQAEAKKLNGRTPELAQASLQQLKLLRQNLPQRGQQVLDATVTTALQQRQAKIHSLFPEATDEQVSTLMLNLTDQAKQQCAEVAQTLFDRHQQALNGIVEDITHIQGSEPVNAQQEPATWQMALLIFDIAREDLRSLEPPEQTTAPAKGKSKAKKEANK